MKKRALACSSAASTSPAAATNDSRGSCPLPVLLPQAPRTADSVAADRAREEEEEEGLPVSCGVCGMGMQAQG